MTISDTAFTFLRCAASREDRLVQRRPTTPLIADINTCRGLAKQGLAAMVSLPVGATDIVTIREGECPMAFFITDAGFGALGMEVPGSADPEPTAGPTTSHTIVVAEMVRPRPSGNTMPILPPHTATTIRGAAQAVLTAWGDEDKPGEQAMAALKMPIAALRTILAQRATRTTSGPRKRREGTKQQAVLTLLRRDERATVAQVMDATSWASHTVRGFFAGLKKKGVALESIKASRKIGPDQEGGKASYTVYHVGTAA